MGEGVTKLPERICAILGVVGLFGLYFGGWQKENLPANLFVMFFCFYAIWLGIRDLLDMGKGTKYDKGAK